MCGDDEQQMTIQVLDEGFQIHKIWYHEQPKLEQIQKQTQERSDGYRKQSQLRVF